MASSPNISPNNAGAVATRRAEREAKPTETTRRADLRLVRAVPAGRYPDGIVERLSVPIRDWHQYASAGSCMSAQAQEVPEPGRGRWPFDRPELAPLKRTLNTTAMRRERARDDWGRHDRYSSEAAAGLLTAVRLVVAEPRGVAGWLASLRCGWCGLAM